MPNCSQVGGRAGRSRSSCCGRPQTGPLEATCNSVHPPAPCPSAAARELTCAVPGCGRSGSISMKSSSSSRKTDGSRISRPSLVTPGGGSRSACRRRCRCCWGPEGRAGPPLLQPARRGSGPGSALAASAGLCVGVPQCRRRRRSPPPPGPATTAGHASIRIAFLLVSAARLRTWGAPGRAASAGSGPRRAWAGPARRAGRRDHCLCRHTHDGAAGGRRRGCLAPTAVTAPGAGAPVGPCRVLMNVCTLRMALVGAGPPSKGVTICISPCPAGRPVRPSRTTRRRPPLTLPTPQ